MKVSKSFSLSLETPKTCRKESHRLSLLAISLSSFASLHVLLQLYMST